MSAGRRRPVGLRAVGKWATRVAVSSTVVLAAVATLIPEVAFAW